MQRIGFETERSERCVALSRLHLRSTVVLPRSESLRISLVDLTGAASAPAPALVVFSSTPFQLHLSSLLFSLTPLPFTPLRPPMPPRKVSDTGEAAAAAARVSAAANTAAAAAQQAWFEKELAKLVAPPSQSRKRAADAAELSDDEERKEDGKRQRNDVAAAAASGAGAGGSMTERQVRAQAQQPSQRLNESRDVSSVCWSVLRVLTVEVHEVINAEFLQVQHD